MQGHEQQQSRSQGSRCERTLAPRAANARGAIVVLLALTLLVTVARAQCPALTCSAVVATPAPSCGEPIESRADVAGGEGALTVEWDLNADAVPDAFGNPIRAILSPGTVDVSVTITDTCADPSPQQCSLVLPVTMFAAPMPVVVASGPIDFCASTGGSVTLDAGAGFVLYQWLLDDVALPGEDRQAITLSATGEYTVTTRDADGCERTSLPMYIDASACGCATPRTCESAVATPSTVCEGQAMMFFARYHDGQGRMEVGWDFNGDINTDAIGNPVSEILPVGPHVVTVRVVDRGCPPFPNSCNMTLDVVVLPAGVPALSASGPTTFCAAFDESVTLIAETGFASYVWLRDGVTMLSETGETLRVVRSGSYEVIAGSANGCERVSSRVVVDAEACPPCRALQCVDIVATAGPVCDEQLVTLSAVTVGGLAPLSFEWDWTGDGVADAAGNPAIARLPAGPLSIGLVVTDACADPGAQQCTGIVDVIVAPDRIAVGELSDVLSGAEPLRVIEEGVRLMFALPTSRWGVNVHVAALGAWYDAGPVPATECHRLDWIDEGGGMASLAVSLATDTWILVTASDDCVEGVAGRDSGGRERASAPTWMSCGALP